MGVAAILSASHAHPTDASTDFKHYAKKLGQYQIFQKLFLLVQTKATRFQKKGIKHISISNIDTFKQKSWSLPFQPYQISLNRRSFTISTLGFENLKKGLHVYHVLCVKLKALCFVCSTNLIHMLDFFFVL